MSKILLFSLVLILLISCSETTKIVNQQPSKLTYQFSEYIIFDTTDAYVVANTWKGKSYLPEFFVYWEEIIGEPFTDVNGNGVYDQSIDIFIKSVGPDNMDLNHDGKHTGPDDPWTINVPFDDLNRNGICDMGPRNMRSRFYVDGTPYHDFNNNGVWDSTTTYDCSVVECSSLVLEASTYFSFKNIDSSFVYISDSNYTYNLFSSFSYEDVNFILNENGLLSFQLNPFDYFNSIEMLTDLNHISSDSSFVQGMYAHNYNNDSLFKEIILKAELEYKDSLYTDLLLIRYSKYDWDKYMDISLEIYFAKEIGLIALFDYHFINRGSDRSLYFIDKTETVPILLKR